MTVGTLGAAAVFGLAFVRRSLTSANAVLDLRLFRNRVFATANGAGFFLGEAVLDANRFAGEAAIAAGDEVARTLEEALGPEGLALATEVSEALRGAFATAVSRVFGVLVWLVAGAALFTLWLPGLELRGAAPTRG